MVPASEQTDAQQRRALLKVEQILQGATQVFLSQGYDRASMNQVAKTAGVSSKRCMSTLRTRKPCLRLW